MSVKWKASDFNTKKAIRAQVWQHLHQPVDGRAEQIRSEYTALSNSRCGIERGGQAIVCTNSSRCGDYESAVAERVACLRLAAPSKGLVCQQSRKPISHQCMCRVEAGQKLGAILPVVSRPEWRPRLNEPAVKPDCCGRLFLIRSGRILASTTWANTFPGTESREIGR